MKCIHHRNNNTITCYQTPHTHTHTDLYIPINYKSNVHEKKKKTHIFTCMYSLLQINLEPKHCYSLRVVSPCTHKAIVFMAATGLSHQWIYDYLSLWALALNGDLMKCYSDSRACELGF